MDFLYANNHDYNYAWACTRLYGLDRNAKEGLCAKVHTWELNSDPKFTSNKRKHLLFVIYNEFLSFLF